MMSDYDSTTGLIVTDLQNDFADPAGSLYVAGGEEVVPIADREIDGAGEAGALIVYTQDWHPPSTPHFLKDGGTWPVHCVQGSWGAAFHPDVAVVGDVVQKGVGGEDGYSGFSVRDPVSGERGATTLEALLRRGGVARLVIIGLATDYCVKETALDGVRLGFDAVVLLDGCRAVNLRPGDGERAVNDMKLAGVRVEHG
jgi:nicotinamidase/pyrazinamidase